MRLRLLGRPERTGTTSPVPNRPQPRMRVRLRRHWRVGVLARTAWCAHCEARPRADLPGGAGRFCSIECANAEADDNWSIA
jgi:hypothetical protein